MPKVYDGQVPKVFSIGLFTSSNVLYKTLKKHGFTKMPVSISANYGPILKIQNLAYSGERTRPVRPPTIGARIASRDYVRKTMQCNVSNWFYQIIALLASQTQQGLNSSIIVRFGRFKWQNPLI